MHTVRSAWFQYLVIPKSINNAQRFCLEQEMHTVRSAWFQYLVIPKCSCQSISHACGQFFNQCGIF